VFHGLIDCTALGSAKNGVSFRGKTGLYFKGFVEKAGFIPYTTLDGIFEDEIYVDPEEEDKLIVGNYSISLVGSDLKPATLRDILIKIIPDGHRVKKESTKGN
jgi:hypothetical protein|tara:strand:- start:672 stop:980 length:309 start_codon:yes stop_codon:yes gene_type:complete